MPNVAYPGQHIDIEIPYGSRDHEIVPDTVKITFNLDTKSTDKHVVLSTMWAGHWSTKVLMLGLKDIDTINNSDIYDTYKDLYLSKKRT